MEDITFSSEEEIFLKSPLALFGGCGFGKDEKFLLTLIFKNVFLVDIAFSRKEERVTKNPLALFR